MNVLFSDWLRPVSVDHAGIDLPARIQAADALAEEATRETVLDLVRVVYGFGVSAETDASLRAGFKEAEPAFPMRDNDAEMKIITAAVLEEVCRAGEVQLRIFASYAVTVAECRGLDAPLPELSAAAAESLMSLGVSRRQPLSKPEVKKSVLNKDIKTALDEFLATAQAAPASTIKELLQTITSGVQAALTTTASQTSAVADWADHNARLAAEDSHLLWWLLSGSSTTLGEPWCSLPTRALAVVAGRELANAAVVLPAPPQSAALLQQLLSVHPRPKKPISEAKVTALDVPEELAFLISDLASDEGPDAPADVARHSLNQTMLVRAWDELE